MGHQFSGYFSQWVKQKHMVLIPEKCQGPYHGVLILTTSLIQNSWGSPSYGKERQ